MEHLGIYSADLLADSSWFPFVGRALSVGKVFGLPGTTKAAVPGRSSVVATTQQERLIALAPPLTSHQRKRIIGSPIVASVLFFKITSRLWQKISHE